LKSFIFKAFDADHSGKIEFTEFLIAFNIRSKGSLDQKLNWTFDVYDHNSDGIIDRKELHKMFTLLFTMMEVDTKEEKYDVNKRVDAMLKQVDTSGDKVLSREEFIEGIKRDEHLKKLLIDHKIID
jgi:Ca2+-binding EF-hand superfamily protein